MNFFLPRKILWNSRRTKRTKIETERQELLYKIKEMTIEYIVKYSKLPTTQDIHNTLGDDFLIGIPMSGIDIPKDGYITLPPTEIVITKNFDIMLLGKKVHLESQLKAIYIFFFKAAPTYRQRSPLS